MVMKFDVWRSRWAAAGAAVAITFGGGGLFAASALGNAGDASLLVPVMPVRVLDTRDASSAIPALNQGTTVTLSLLDSSLLTPRRRRSTSPSSMERWPRS